MAEQPTATSSSTTSTHTVERKSGSSAWLAFLVGGLLVVVALIAWFMMSGANPAVEAPAVPSEIDVNVSAPDLPAPSAPDVPTPAPSN